MPSIKDLPSELLYHIVSYLPVSANIALKLTNKELAGHTPPNLDLCSHDLPRCAKIVIFDYFQESKELRQELRNQRRRCVVCRNWFLLDRFEKDSFICKDHKDWGLSNSTASTREISTEARWLARPAILCLHCKSIESEPFRSCRCRNDPCEDCWSRPTWTFDRVGNGAQTLRRRSLQMTTSGALQVREEHSSDRKDAFEIVTPVVFD